MKLERVKTLTRFSTRRDVYQAACLHTFSSTDGIKLLFLLCNYSPAYFTVYNYDNSLLWPRITSTGFLKTVHEKCPGASWSIGWRANQCSCFFRKSFDRKWLAQVYGYAYDDGMGLMRCSSATHYTVSWRLFHGQWRTWNAQKGVISGIISLDRSSDIKICIQV